VCVHVCIYAAGYVIMSVCLCVCVCVCVCDCVRNCAYVCVYAHIVMPFQIHIYNILRRRFCVCLWYVFTFLARATRPVNANVQSYKCGQNVL